MRKLLPGKGANHHYCLLGTPSNDRLKGKTLEGGKRCVCVCVFVGGGVGDGETGDHTGKRTCSRNLLRETQQVTRT